MTDEAGREAFVRANTALAPVPLVPTVRLHLAADSTALWQATEAELDRAGLPPPYWAFAWAGGQALARHVLDHPGLVRGRRVLDAASGSGLVGIAAMLAGAAAVACADVDAFAATAARLNAAANGVAVDARVGDPAGTDEGWDAVLCADAFYERDLAARVAPWLEGLHRRGALVLLGDPGRAYLPRERLAALASFDVPVTRDLEDAEVKRTTVWRFRDR